MVEIGVGDHRVLTHDIDALDLAGLVSEHVDQLGDGETDFAFGNLAAPCIHHLLAHFGDDDCLVPGIHVCERSHVAGALHIVLATQRTDARAGSPEVAGQHLEVGDRLDIVDTGRVLGDTHRVEDRRLAGFAKPLCRSDKILCGNTADLGHVLDAVGVLHHDFFYFLEILGPFRNEVLVLPAVFQDLLHEAVEDCHITSGIKR